ncbi:Rv1733c family protein [Actinomadura macra]|uniref:Rv1733c family protein n=1 Tax=Actinomadura macra TaxID=46164 RepID=UPI000836D3C0|nr:hypothetical protein [Actinomadura macra]
MTPVTPWVRLNRWRRSCGFDDNDLRRDVDRNQRMLGLLLLITFLAVAPPVCVRVSQAVYSSGVRAERHEALTRHRVDATVVKVDNLRSGRQVTVVWDDRNGSRRTGSYTTWHGASVGGHPKVWADSATVGDEPPRRHAQTIADTLVTGPSVTAALGLPLLGAYALVRRRCDLRRYRLWDAEWAAFDRRRIGP